MLTALWNFCFVLVVYWEQSQNTITNSVGWWMWQWDISRIARYHFQRSGETTFYWQNICLWSVLMAITFERVSFSWFVSHTRLWRCFYIVWFFSIGCFYSWIHLNASKQTWSFFPPNFFLAGGGGVAPLQSQRSLSTQRGSSCCHWLTQLLPRLVGGKWDGNGRFQWTSAAVS